MDLPARQSYVAAVRYSRHSAYFQVPPLAFNFRFDVAHNGRILGSLKAGKGTDLIGYNPTLRHVHVPDAKQGTLAIIRLSPGRATLAWHG